MNNYNNDFNNNEGTQNNFNGMPYNNFNDGMSNNDFNAGMQGNFNAGAQPVYQISENVIAGIVGAFLFALLGGLIYFVIYQFGFIAGICGVVTFVLATMGYQKFAKNISVKGVIISIIVSVVVIFLAEYLSLGYTIYDVFKTEYELSFFDGVRLVPDFLTEPEVLGGFIKDLAISYILGAISAFATVKQMLKGARR